MSDTKLLCGIFPHKMSHPPTRIDCGGVSSLVRGRMVVRGYKDGKYLFTCLPVASEDICSKLKSITLVRA